MKNLPAEKDLVAFHDAMKQAGMDEEARRLATAYKYGGYIDSRCLVKLYETSGFPLEEAAAWAAQSGLRLDFLGLNHELVMIGMNPRTVDLLIERMRRTYDDTFRLRGSEPHKFKESAA